MDQVTNENIDLNDGHALYPSVDARSTIDIDTGNGMFNNSLKYFKNQKHFFLCSTESDSSSSNITLDQSSDESYDKENTDPQESRRESWFDGLFNAMKPVYLRAVGRRPSQLE